MSLCKQRDMSTPKLKVLPSSRVFVWGQEPHLAHQTGESASVSMHSQTYSCCYVICFS
jgi:hypothetical protein